MLRGTVKWLKGFLNEGNDNMYMVCFLWVVEENSSRAQHRARFVLAAPLPAISHRSSPHMGSLPQHTPFPRNHQLDLCVLKKS